jgi:effector-binding domain-containing protein
MTACRVASLIYRGENGYMSAYAAIRLWLATAGTKIVGPKREIYLDTGGEDGEPVTEIQFPITS